MDDLIKKTQKVLPKEKKDKEGNIGVLSLYSLVGDVRKQQTTMLTMIRKRQYCSLPRRLGKRLSFGCSN